MLIQRLKRGLAWLLASLLVLAAIAGCTSQAAPSPSRTLAAQGQETPSQNQTSAQEQDTSPQSQTPTAAREQDASPQSQTPTAAREQDTSSQSQTLAAAQDQAPAESQEEEASGTQEESATAQDQARSADEDQKAEATQAQEAPAIEEDGSYTTRDEVALYLHTYGRLPDNYITKKDAENLGWDSKKGNLWEVAPGKSIGGSYFGNYEKQLPEKKGRNYYECDINYQGKYRGAERIIYSDDGLIFYTGDHYETFEQLYP